MSKLNLTIINKEGDARYLISSNWLEKWKKMHYYDLCCQEWEPEFDESKEKEIWPISNHELILDQNDFYTDEDPNSYYNYILKPDVKPNNDYKLINQDIWRFFYTKYGGTEIKRFYYKNSPFGIQIEIHLKEIKVVVLPHLEDWNVSTISSPKSIYISKHDKLKTLLERIEKILNSTGEFNLSQDRMRPWRLTSNTDLAKFDHAVRTAIESKIQDEEMSKENIDIHDSWKSKMEMNTGVKFPGDCIEHMRDFAIDEIELSADYTLVIETASSDTKKFIFQYEKFEALGYGKCEYCYSNKFLITECKCKTVQYCCERWMIKDIRFHKDKCIELRYLYIG